MLTSTSHWSEKEWVRYSRHLSQPRGRDEFQGQPTSLLQYHFTSPPPKITNWRQSHGRRMNEWELPYKFWIQFCFLKHVLSYVIYIMCLFTWQWNLSLKVIFSSLQENRGFFYQYINLAALLPPGHALRPPLLPHLSHWVYSQIQCPIPKWMSPHTKILNSIYLHFLRSPWG